MVCSTARQRRATLQRAPVLVLLALCLCACCAYVYAPMQSRHEFRVVMLKKLKTSSETSALRAPQSMTSPGGDLVRPLRCLLISCRRCPGCWCCCEVGTESRTMRSLGGAHRSLVPCRCRCC